MDWRAKVELFEQIRREYEFGVGTIVGVAKKLGVHRRMVREAIGSAAPKSRKRSERPPWKLSAAVEFIDAVLEADRKAPRKQQLCRPGERIKLQAHELAFAYFGGVFRKLRYDNLTSAVKGSFAERDGKRRHGL